MDNNLKLGTILFIVFLILKLCGTITWSWWWVTAPLWIPISWVVFLVILALVLDHKTFNSKIKEYILKEKKRKGL